MNKITFALMLLFSGTVLSQTPEQVKKIRASFDTNKLEQLQDVLKKKEAKDAENVKAYILKNKIDIKQSKKDGSFKQLMRISEGGIPVFYEMHNAGAAESTRTNFLHTGGGLGLALDGQGMVARVWDGGPAFTSHNEFGTRVTAVDNTILDGNSFHGTHVLGTFVASGGPNYFAKGMAPMATARTFDWTNDESETVSEALSGMLVANYSYGFPLSDSEDWATGGYIEESRTWDQIAYNAPYFLQVFAAGNDGWGTNPQPTATGYDKLVGNKTSKNNLVVANANNATINASNGGFISGSISGGSSQGPADDGRIKPDITGNGTSITSTDRDAVDDYRVISGTSMASPNVAGSLLIVQQHYNNVNNRFMRAETLKALAIHTADDTGRPGPDANFGWGYLNAKACVETITANGTSSYITEAVLNNGETYTYSVNAIGGQPLKVSVVWTDPAGNWINDTDQIVNNPRAALVNDLDVRVTEGSNTYYPWKLNVANVAANATRNSDNLVDNIESVLVDNPTATLHTITINHKGTLTNNKQRFALVVTGLTSGFTLKAQEVLDIQCSSNDAVFNFDYKQITPGTTTFTALNIPVGMTVGFNNATMNSDGTLTATFGGFANVISGEYNVYVEGTNGADKERRNVFIKVYNSTLVNTVITSPTNGQSGLDSTVSFNWSDDFNATAYNLEIADNVAFTPVLSTLNDLTSTSLQLQGLVQGQVYYVRIFPKNSCGISSEATTSSFQIGTLDCVNVSGASFAIPDEGSDSKSVNITDDYNISDLNLFINYTHTYLGDIAYVLTSPTGTQRIAINASNCNVSGTVDSKFDDSGSAFDCANILASSLNVYSPDNAFSSYNGESSVGNWTLTAYDTARGDTGDVNSWSVQACKTVNIIQPNLIRNNAITIEPLATHVYSETTDLKVSSATETAVQQIFTVVELPTLGYLQLNTTTLILGATFTQDDINSGNFKYVNTTSTLLAADATDTFTVNVLNNDNGWLANQKATINIDASLSVVDNTIENAVVFPNPTSSNLTVVLPNVLKVDAISIIDVRGRLIKTFNSLKGNRATINVADLESGAYFISIQTKEAKTFKRFIKK